MGNFDRKLDTFYRAFFDGNGYKTVIEGLQNTITIAVLGLVIGILIGTLIATVRVLPKYKTLPKVLNGICSVYVGFFRGTPMGCSASCILLCTYADNRFENAVGYSCNLGIRFKQRSIHI